MDINFFDDCGLEGHDHLHYELAQVRSEYLAADVEQIKWLITECSALNYLP